MKRLPSSFSLFFTWDYFSFRLISFSGNTHASANRREGKNPPFPPFPPFLLFLCAGTNIVRRRNETPEKKDTLSYKVRNIARLSFPSFLARLPFPLFPKSVIYGQNTSLPSLIWETAGRGGGNTLLCLAVEAASRTHTHTHTIPAREK